MQKDDKTGLYLPPSGGMTRRSALRLGAFGVGGLALGGMALAACGDDDDSSAGGTTTTAGGDTSTTAAGGGGEAKDSIKAHWVYIGPPDDNGWTQRHDEGRLAAASAIGDRLETAFTPNIGFDASTTQLFTQLADDGNDIIFANTEYAGLLSDVAAEYPDVKFAECNGHVFTDNLFGYYMAHETTAYLLGVAAGMLAENGRIGYIGAFPTATAYNDVNGLLLGARSVNPDATVEVVMVSTFFDPQAAAQASEALLNNGVEFLFGVMDEPTFMQLAEDAGVWTGYWNGDLPEAAPTKYVAGFDLSGFGDFYTDQCQKVLDGTWSAPSEVVLTDTPLGAWGPEVPEDVQSVVADAEAKLASGELSVYSGPLTSNTGAEALAAGETLDSLGAYGVDFAVEGVNGLE
jgi:basic membrane lipoprotein Med (substrate-binding protein (PBP1-ABC) superfamily)